jgi:hypothetical protein
MPRWHEAENAAMASLRTPLKITEGTGQMQQNIASRSVRESRQLCVIRAAPAITLKCLRLLRAAEVFLADATLQMSVVSSWVGKF